MIKKFMQSKILSTGLAMFSMFFGAGNIVFPLALGNMAGASNFFAMAGLMITAVVVPFTGLIAMILFNGDYKAFFGRMGTAPGFLIALFIMCLIGPFGGIPRCIALSYSTITMFTPAMPLYIFSLFSCLIIFAFTYKTNAILEILGYVLTPVLLISLIIIIVLGLLSENLSGGKADPNFFFTGLKEGYHTMDLLASFFFSYVVIDCLQKDLHPVEIGDFKSIIVTALKASAIGAFLLGAVYAGFSYVAAFSGPELHNVSEDLLLGTISLNILGPYAGIVASVAVALACLTTAIALSAAFSEFLYETILQKKIGYIPCLLLTLVITCFVSTLDFTGIVKVLTPILMICYPALIVLSVLNLLYKLYGFKPVKFPVFFVFFLTVLYTIVV